MGGFGETGRLILVSLEDMGPMSSRDIVKQTELTGAQVYNALHRLWRSGAVLRTRMAIKEPERVFRGRRGVSRHTRPYHLYLLGPDGVEEVVVDGQRYVGFSRENLDPRGGGGLSKAQRVLDFLRENGDRAFFSKDVVEALSDSGVKPRDVMSNVRRFERMGLVYVRGYKTDDRQTPFRRGYLLTWVDPEKPREQAIEEAVERTDRSLQGQASGSPMMERVHRITDMVIEHSKMRKLVSHSYMENRLGCSPYEAEHALSRALQLYPDLGVVKLFGAYRYYHHSSLSEADLHAAVEMKKSYLRIAKGRANRVGHNWEAVAEWFIDRFTTGARFWTQDHLRGGMDSKRITLHLLKGVGGRRNAAEVDRVWEVTPGLFAPPITYVLSCKWGLVNKRHVDDFLEVLKWSKDFGVDTPDGREVRQAVVGVFAASAFNPKEHVRLKDESIISLAQYAARRNLQLVTASDFNGKLRERGCQRGVTVQKVCRLAKDEKEVRETLDEVWKQPKRAEEIFSKLREKNEGLYRFEEMLEKEDSSAL
jgi:DNA-binding MarR family transcriptional regulator